MDEWRLRWESALRLPGEENLASSAVTELQHFFPDRHQRDLTEQMEQGEALCAKRWYEMAVNPRSEASLTHYYDGTNLKIFSLMHYHSMKPNEGPLNYVVALQIAKAHGCHSYMDYGSGIGSGGILFAQEGFDVTLCDISSPLLQFAKWRFAERGLKGSFLDLKQQQPTIPVDVITCLEVLEHVPDPLKLLRKLHTYLRDGGFLIVTAPFGVDEERPNHIVHNRRLALKFRGQGYRHQWELKTPFREIIHEPMFIMQKVHRSSFANGFLSFYDYYVPEMVRRQAKRVRDALSGHGGRSR